MTAKKDVADALYTHIVEAANELTEDHSGETVTRGLEQLANAYALVSGNDKRSTM